MTRESSTERVPQLLRIRTPGQMRPGDFRLLLGVFADLGITVPKHRYEGGEEEGPLSTVGTSVGALVLLRAAMAERDAVRSTVPPAEIDIPIAKPVSGIGVRTGAPTRLHASRIDFTAFAGRHRSPHTEHIASTTWATLHKFWEQRDVRGEYLLKGAINANEVNPGVAALTLERSGLPLSFDTFEIDGEPTDHVNLLSLYNSVKIVQASRTRGLVPGLGGQRIGFVSDYLNSNLDQAVFPPLPVAS